MKNSEQSAFPLERHETNSVGLPETVFELGLTKREYFAAMAMQGMLSNPLCMEVIANTGEDRDYLAKESIRLADELLKQLEQ